MLNGDYFCPWTEGDKWREVECMPSISTFFGINIKMYSSNEHNPPHFHAEYQGFKAVCDFNGELIKGAMPKRQMKFIAAWAEIHKDELTSNWELAMQEKPLAKINPLR